VAHTLALLLGHDHDAEVSIDPRSTVKAILAGDRFDVIFCDLMMPEMTGMEFYAALSGPVPEQAERIVFVTGGVFTPAAREFVEGRSHAVLEKPFDMKAVEAVLARHLGRIQETTKKDSTRLKARQHAH